MEADLKLEELSSTIKSKAMKDTAPGPDGIPYSVYNKLWEHAGHLIWALRFLPTIPLPGGGIPLMNGEWSNRRIELKE